MLKLNSNTIPLRGIRDGSKIKKQKEASDSDNDTNQQKGSNMRGKEGSRERYI